MAYAACGREIVFTDPCRIYHVDHGTASWRPEPRLIERAIAALPLSPRRSKRILKYVRTHWPPRSQMDRRGVPYLNLKTTVGRDTFESLVRRIVEEKGAFTYNDADWGLGAHEFDDQTLR
jgi:hypothetical protein